MKTCTKCQKEYEPNSINFPANKNTIDGYGSWCRGCVKQLNRSRRPIYTYGLTDTQVKLILEHQNNSCAICFTSFDLVPMNIDHKEDTDGAVIVRGILCNRCNTMLGTYNDSSSELSDKITQLESKLKQLTSLNSYLSENLAFKTGKVKQ